MGQKPLEIGTFETQFAKLITAKNRARGGTVRSLADTSGVSRSRLDRILRGETPITVTDIERISSALGLESWKVFFAIQTGRPYEEADAALAERLARRRLAAETTGRSVEVVRIPAPGDPDFEPIPPSEEDVWRLAANFTREDVERSRLEEIGEESQLPPEERDDHIA